jgi:hypothetical protein
MKAAIHSLICDWFMGSVVVASFADICATDFWPGKSRW